MGLNHVYLGNVYDTDSTTTRCHSCRLLQVTRYGLNAQIVGLSPEGRCAGCGTDAHFTLLADAATRKAVPELPDAGLDVASFSWHGDVRALHVQVSSSSSEPAVVYQRRFGDPAVPETWSVIPLRPGESFRFIAAKSTTDEQGVMVAVPERCTSTLHEVFDRAHFPTVELDAGSRNGDITPFPAYLPIVR